MGRPFYHVHNTMALFLGLAFLVLGLFPFARTLNSNSWQQAEGRIIVSELLFEDDQTWMPPMTFRVKVAYRYTVAGKTHLGSRVEFGIGSRLFLARPFAQRLLERYPPGKSVTVFYNPATPGDCVLERSPSLGTSVFWMMLGIGLAAAGLFVRFAEKWE